ncbi:T9SS type A sorting domain-containing protein [Flavobacterium sp.]
MKRLLLFLLISNLAFSQSVEIRLVNPMVGAPSCNYFFNDWMCNTTNDAGLNAIFSTYGVQYFKVKGGHPYYNNTTIMALSGNYPPQFVAELSAYSSVVASAKFWDPNTFSDVLFLSLANASIGTFTGTNNNIVVTNDANLNQIFQTYNVIQYGLYVASVSDTVYTLTCDCDVALLKAALQNYPNVVDEVDFFHAAFLSNQQFEQTKAIIAPNPFSDNFSIETEQPISNYSIIDITGKTIAATSSKSELDNQSSRLSAGIYILNLLFDNGQTANYKLVKK